MYHAPHPQLHQTRRVQRLLNGSELGTLAGIADPFLAVTIFSSIATSARLEPAQCHEAVSYIPGQGLRWSIADGGVSHLNSGVAGRSGFHILFALPSGAQIRENLHVDFANDDIPAVIFRHAEVKVLAGRYHGLLGPVMSPVIRPLIMDVMIDREAELMLPVSEGHSALVYVFGGAAAVGLTLVDCDRAAVLSDGNLIRLISGAEPVRALVMTAQPLGLNC